MGRTFVIFAAYLLAPALLVRRPVTEPGRLPWRELLAITLLWLPIEFHLLPSLRIAALGGFDVAKLPGLIEALVLFRVVAKLPDVGLTWRVRPVDVGIALAAFVAFTIVALPIGFATGFITWHPRLDTNTLLAKPLLIYALIALPEEFLFRGLIQNLLTRWRGRAIALPMASIVFGLAHLPDWRYVALATIAGLAYGFVYQRTGKSTASAITHALVDASWVAFLRA